MLVRVFGLEGNSWDEVKLPDGATVANLLELKEVDDELEEENNIRVAVNDHSATPETQLAEGDCVVITQSAPDWPDRPLLGLGGNL